MKPKLILIFVTPLMLAGCASTSDTSPPEGTGDHKIGYELGRSDAVKQQYWMVQNLQMRPKAPPPQTAYLPVAIPGTTTNGVTTVPHTELLLIQK